MTTSALEQYSNTQVPEHQTIPGWRVALIITSFSIAVSSFLNGALTALALGFWESLLCALLAGIILCIGGIYTSIASVRSRLTTYLLVQRSFGIQGAVSVNLVMAIVHYGWFGVNVSIFAGAVIASLNEIYGVQGDFATAVIAGSILMTVSTVFGIRTLDGLALISTPFVGAILVGVCVFAARKHGIVFEPPANPPTPMSFGIALSAMIGGNMMVIATMPDISRYIRSTREAVQGMMLSFPIAMTLLMLAAAIPALALGETDLMKIVVGLGFGLPALIMLLLSTWTINAANLYSASLSLSATFPAVKPWIFTLFGGFIGGGLALMGIIDQFIPFLLLLGLIIPPIAAIYTIDVLKARDTANPPAFRWPALAVWAGSVAVAFAADKGFFTLTTVPMLDASLLAIGAYLLVVRYQRREAQRAV